MSINHCWAATYLVLKGAFKREISRKISIDEYATNVAQ